MKKAVPFIIGGVVLLVLITLMLANRGVQQRRLDERITLRQQDKIPYGTRVAKTLLSSVFPYASLLADNKSPGNWDSIYNYGSRQAVILMSDYFDADTEELNELSSFVAEGNYVLIIARSASDDFANFFKLNLHSSYYYEKDDSLRVGLTQPAYAVDSIYSYPGKKYDSYFNSIDAEHTTILGNNGMGKSNFIQLNKGKGSFFIHTAPLAFSNYFVLHKSNVGYYQKVLSVLPANVKTILWNEYYLAKPSHDNNDDERGWLSAMFSQPAFKWAFWVAAFTLLLFILLGMRRRQRMIPPYERPKNDSLDFVKTLGRLYYDKRDHKNLAAKMTAYFLEHVRTRYKVSTHELSESFIQSLHYKSGYAEESVRRIVASIEAIKTKPVVSDNQLADFHKQLEAFYQNT